MLLFSTTYSLDKNMVKHLHRFLILFSGTSMLLASSCMSTKKTVYFADIDSTAVRRISAAEFSDPVIQSNDLLGINIQTIDPKSSAPVNQSTGVESPGQPPSTANSLLVDKDGNVELPMLGIVKVGGLTTSGAREVIRKHVSKFYKDPTVQVRFTNYKISVIGEVTKPGTYTINNENVSVLDAISLAGDLTIYGKRNNVMLIRNDGNFKEVVRLDLSSSRLMNSPYFYLKQNDMLYVEPNRARMEANNAPKYQLITVALSVATLIVTALARF